MKKITDFLFSIHGRYGTELHMGEEMENYFFYEAED